MDPPITTRKERNVSPIIIFLTAGFMKYYRLSIKSNPKEIQIFRTISRILGEFFRLETNSFV